MLASSAVDRGFDSWLGQTKDHEIGICCFFAKHVAIRRKSKDGFARNQDNVSEWGDMWLSICELLFQWATYKNPTKRVGLLQSGPHHHFIEN
jgi:hypothetical protein